MQNHLLRIMSIASCVALMGCGSQKYYFGSPFDATPNSKEPVQLIRGEVTSAIKVKQGLMWGGYEPGLVVENPEIVTVEHQESGRKIYTYLIGLNKGTTRVYHVNRYIIPQEVPDAAWIKENTNERESFVVTVE